MFTAEIISKAIGNAEELKSKITSSGAYNVPALASLRIRCLLNNLGESAINYMECGVHRAGTFSSSVYDNKNIKNAYAIDSWASDHMQGEVCEVDFRKNAAEFTPLETKLHIIKSDCFNVDLSLIKDKIDFYLYDAGHSYDDQKQALTYYYPVLADTFILCVDDYDLPEVEKGTLDGIKEMGLTPIYTAILKGGDHDNDGWWRGYGVFLLTKNK